MGLAIVLSSLYLTGGGFLFWTLEGETFSTSPYGTAIEGKQWGSYLNAIYFCAVTLTTIGYGDLVPTTPQARSILIVYAIIGLCIMGFTMASISHVAVSNAHYYLRLGGSFLFSEDDLDHDSDRKRSTCGALCHAIRRIPDRVVRLLIGVIIFFTVLFTGAFVFGSIEGWEFAESVYFCFVTLTTIGYGDYTPQTTAGRCVVIPFAFMGLGITSFLLTETTRFFVNKVSVISHSIERSFVTFNFEDRYTDTMAEMLKEMNTNIIPNLRTEEEAESLIATLHAIVGRVEKRKSRLQPSSLLFPK